MSNYCPPIPVSIADAVNILLSDAVIIHKDIKDQIATVDETTFIRETHHSLGAHLRYCWNLWWTDDVPERFVDSVPPKPAVVEEFHNIGITAADTMSAVILARLYRSLHQKETDTAVQQYTV